MYQTHEPHRPNHVIGVSAAIVVTTLAAIGISSGLARDIIVPGEQKMEVIMIDAPETISDPVEIEQPNIEDIEVPMETPIDVVIPDIEIAVIPDTTPIAVEPPPTPAPTRVASGNNASAPKLIVDRKPTYPAPSRRAQEEGVTTLSVCVSESGRTQSVQLQKSSGHARLDEAALNWMKSARFRPAKADGRNRAVCGHIVAYEWNLEDAR